MVKPKDYYRILNVPETAPADEIKKAYRKLALKYHPDRTQGNKQAEERFKEISEAHYVLSDEKRRREYDRLRTGAGPGSAKEFDFEELLRGFRGSYGSAEPPLFEEIFGGGGGHGRRAFYFRNVPFGSEWEEENEPPQMQQVKTDILSDVVLTRQQAGRGGKVMINKSGSGTLSVRLPEGVRDGQVLRLRNQGTACPCCDKKGDLLLKIHVQRE